MALMLSRGPSCLGVGTDLEGDKVFSTVVVFVHPRQELLTIKEGASCLIDAVEQADSPSSSESDVTALCELPRHRHGRFYPSAINYAYLVLPYFANKGKPKKLRLDLVMCRNCHLVVRQLHQWQGKLGDLALLLPVFSRDPTVPICSQSDTSVKCGSTRSTARRLLQAVAGWGRCTPPSPDSLSAAKR